MSTGGLDAAARHAIVEYLTQRGHTKTAQAFEQCMEDAGQEASPIAGAKLDKLMRLDAKSDQPCNNALDVMVRRMVAGSMKSSSSSSKSSSSAAPAGGSGMFDIETVDLDGGDGAKASPANGDSSAEDASPMNAGGGKEKRERKSSKPAAAAGEDVEDWPKEQISALKKAVKENPETKGGDKQERWRAIAALVSKAGPATARNKKDCHEKYKQLKERAKRAKEGKGSGEGAPAAAAAAAPAAKRVIINGIDMTPEDPTVKSAGTDGGLDGQRGLLSTGGRVGAVQDSGMRSVGQRGGGQPRLGEWDSSLSAGGIDLEADMAAEMGGRPQSQAKSRQSGVTRGSRDSGSGGRGGSGGSGGDGGDDLEEGDLGATETVGGGGRGMGAAALFELCDE